MRPSCQTCRFSHSRAARNPRARDKEIMTCRRWPPQADSAPWGGQARAVFPRVFPEDWCGEYQRLGASLEEVMAEHGITEAELDTLPDEEE